MFNFPQIRVDYSFICLRICYHTEDKFHSKSIWGITIWSIVWNFNQAGQLENPYVWEWKGREKGIQEEKYI
jgi:hypothetical protein